MITALLLALAVTGADYQYTWEKFENNPTQYALMRDGKQVGLWSTKSCTYWPLVDGQWGKPHDPPVDPPYAVSKNFGLDLGKVAGYKSWTRNGREVSRAEAFRALEVPDDSRLLRLTVIGSPAQRRQVLDDIKSRPQLLKEVVVQDYSPDDWAVKGVGFFAGGSPTIYLQSPEGKVLHRQDTYEGIDNLIQAIRKADPKYQPDADPNLLLPFQLPALDQFPKWALILVVLFLAFLLWEKRTK